MNVDSMVAGFPAPILDKMEGRPTYETITELAANIHRNTASIHSELGGSANGHLGVSLNPPVYATISAVPWIDPPNPGPLPIIPATSTGNQILAFECQHKALLNMWRTYTMVQDPRCHQTANFPSRQENMA
jgi:hypothetical protein